MLDSSDAIQDFLKGVTIASYQIDLKTRSAVERQLQILTEAAYRLKDDADRLCPQIDWFKVRGLGNFLRHEYHNVDPTAIWNQVHSELPILRQALITAIRKLDGHLPDRPA